MLDTVRYVFAYLTVGSMPFALGYWYAIHPLVDFWRRLGPVRTYTVMVGLMILNLGAAWVWRGPLFAVRYEVGPVHWFVAGAFYVTAVMIEIRCRRHLKFRTLAGMPELAPASTPSMLLQEGIYARVRHPRYLAVAFGTLAAAVFCNYLSVWIVTALTFPGLYGIVLLEESELRERLGEAYVEYSRRVPRFIPRFG